MTTLTDAEPRAELSVQQTDHDPTIALPQADEAGLLTYFGYMSDGRYEIEVAGRELLVERDEVLDLVERLHAIKNLDVADRSARLARLDDDGGYEIEVGGRVWPVPASDVVDWCRGYRAGIDGDGQDHLGEDGLDRIAELLENPSRDDQYRMVILGLMKGSQAPTVKVSRGETLEEIAHRYEVTVDQLKAWNNLKSDSISIGQALRLGPAAVSAQTLAAMIGELPGVDRPPVKKTILEALTFGPDTYMSSKLADRMIAAFGMRWTVTGTQPYEHADGTPLEGPMPEVPQLVLLRRILAASRAGWLRYVDEPSPNRARHKLTFEVSVGQRTYTLPVDHMGAWLSGLAAFHGAEPTG